MNQDRYAQILGNNQEIIDSVLQEFSRICAIPHRSGNEKALSDWLYRNFRARGWQAEQDDLYNLKVDIPAAPGLEHLPPVIIQGHLDMVCAVTEGSGYEPDRDPVTMVVDGDILRSDRRSSLGADNGLSTAIATFLMEKNLRRGPVRLILTAQEEVGMHGASHVDPTWVAGCHWFINGDTAASDALLFSCAGGRRDAFTCPVEQTNRTCSKAYELTLSGFRGGHSSSKVALAQGNAIKLLTFFLTCLRKETSCEVAALWGGHAQNAIPLEAKAVLCVNDEALLTQAVETFRKELAQRYRVTDPDIQATLTPVAAPAQVWSADLTDRMLDLTAMLHHGVHAMHDEIKGIPSASCNTGLVHMVDETTLEIVTFTRCVSAFTEQQMASQHIAAAKRCGFRLDTHSHAGWNGRPDSPLVKLVTETYREQNGSDMAVLATHAGLEPGIFSAKNPDLDMVSIGPDINALHATEESVYLPSVPKFTRLLAAVLEKLADMP